MMHALWFLFVFFTCVPVGVSLNQAVVVVGLSVTLSFNKPAS